MVTHFHKQCNVCGPSRIAILVSIKNKEVKHVDILSHPNLCTSGLAVTKVHIICTVVPQYIELLPYTLRSVLLHCGEFINHREMSMLYSSYFDWNRSIHCPGMTPCSTLLI